jgi:predicted extracellular nuclease
VVDPSVTIGNLIAAISTAGGPTYGYRQINPVNDQDGGEPGGNIRQIFLFRTDRGLSFVDRPGGNSTTATTVTNAGGTAQLSFSPGRIDPTNAAWNSSRKPLAAEFLFNGQRLYVIANHFNSKGGDQPLTGRFQPPAHSSEAQRHQQATIEAGFVQQIRAIDPNANVVVLGDLNDFEFSETIHILEAAGLTDLYDTLPLAERYSYVFEGNSQTLDHILVSGPLLNRSTFDVVHVNAEFADQASDHDPSVARIVMNDEATLCSLAQRVAAKDGVASSLCAKLDNAAAARARGNLKAADNILKSFMNEVNAQRGKSITSGDADLLILLAGRL